MKYYDRFKIVIGSPLWRLYLRWRYSESIKDFDQLGFKPDFNKKGFTCLLCGVGNEVTADEFIKFVLNRTQDPLIWIIDLGEDQIRAVSQMVAIKYPDSKINLKQIDALKLNTLIKPKSVEWIETDGLFEFFDNKSIKNLLAVWKALLKNDGFITTTATSSRWKLQEYFDLFKVWVGKVWLGVIVYTHTRKQMRDNFEVAGFRFVEGPTVVPYFKRYSMIVNNS